jgi:hypothetical protein
MLFVDAALLVPGLTPSSGSCAHVALTLAHAVSTFFDLRPSSRQVSAFLDGSCADMPPMCLVW